MAVGGRRAEAWGHRDVGAVVKEACLYRARRREESAVGETTLYHIKLSNNTIKQTKALRNCYELVLWTG